MGDQRPELLNASEPEASHPQEVTRAKEDPDRDLVEKIRQRDNVALQEAAFRELFDRHHRRVFTLAMGVVRNKTEALDIVQEAFVKVFNNIDKFQGNSTFYTWMYRIVMNLAIDHLRRLRKHRDRAFDERFDQEGGEGEALDDSTSAYQELPSKTMLRQELSSVLQSALETLPPHHRAVIVLREVEGLSYEEMADVLDVPKGTIMSRLFHARRKMQEALQPYLAGDREVEA